MESAIRLALAALLAALICFGSAAQEKFPFPCAKDDHDCIRKVLHSHPIRKLEAWQEMLARPLIERVAPAPPMLVEYVTMDNVANGFPQRPRATQANPSFIAEVKAAIADLPPEINLLLADKLAGIMLVDELGGTGYSDVIVDEKGREVAGYIVLDAQVLASRSANEWATWKESTPFSPEPGWKLTARIEEPARDNRRNAIQYILLHELGHILSIGGDVHPSWTLRPNEVGDTQAYPFFQLSWIVNRKENRYDSHYDEVFPLRRKVAYYFGAKLKASQMTEAYGQLANTNFPTLYAATRPGDDFAESFASYVHVVMMKRPWEITLERPDGPPQVFGACWEEARCADKRRVMERELRLHCVGQSAAQPDRPPPARARHRAQLRVAIDHHRLIHRLQQRQVVHRIAVGRAREITQHRAPRGQPLVQARDLARAHVERSCGPPGEASFNDLRLRRDQMLDAEMRGRELGDVAIGRRRHHAQIAAMPLDEIHRVPRDARHDPVAQEFAPHRFQFLQRAAFERSHEKPRELLRADRARLVARLHLGVARGELLRIEQSALHQEVAPQHVAVAREQRVVQIEKDEPRLHGRLRCHARGRVNVSMP